jgi:hypothetical protein
MMLPQILLSGVLGDIEGFESVHKPRRTHKSLSGSRTRRHDYVLTCTSDVLLHVQYGWK